MEIKQEVRMSDEDKQDIARLVLEGIFEMISPRMQLNKPRKNKRLNIKQTAEYLNTSVTTLNRRRKDTPELKALEHSDGSSSYFMSFELDEYLLKNK